MEVVESENKVSVTVLVDGALLEVEVALAGTRLSWLETPAEGPR